MQKKEGWGVGVIPRLAQDIANDMPEVKGFSERNIGRMIAFAREYPDLAVILPTLSAKLMPSSKVPQAVAKLGSQGDLAILQQLVAKLPWGQNIILMEKVKDIRARRWYVEQTITHGWSRTILALQIDSRAHQRQGKAVHNFHATLPPPQSDLAAQVLKDPYIFDFLTLNTDAVRPRSAGFSPLRCEMFETRAKNFKRLDRRTAKRRERRAPACVTPGRRGEMTTQCHVVAQIVNLPYRRLPIGGAARAARGGTVCGLPARDTADYQSALHREGGEK